MNSSTKRRVTALVAALGVAVGGGIASAAANASSTPAGGPSGAGGPTSTASPGAAGDRTTRPAEHAQPRGLRPPARHGEVGPEPSLPAPNTYSNAYLYNQKNGPVQTDPRIYLIYWGDWSGDNLGVMNRLWNFYRGLGGAPMGTVLSQYQMGCTAGTWNCTGAHAGNPSAPFKSYWKDPSYVPATPTQAQIEAEVRRAASVFGDYSYNAQYVVALPRGHGDSQFVAKGGNACAWHFFTWATSTQWVSYTSLPYMPDAPNCFTNWVNAGSAGTLDGVSMVAGHEYAESVTDPGVNAWLDAYGAENGDKCNTYGGNVALSTGTFPMQATWSNYHRYYYGAGCVFRW